MSARFRIVALLTCALLLPGCASGQDAGSSPAALTGATWLLMSLEHGDTTWEHFGGAKPPDMTFASPEVHGFGGVNRFSGSYSGKSGGKLSIGVLASTRMAGPPKLMDLENAYLAVVGAATSFEINDRKLILTGPEGTARLSR